ncbi:PAS domain S-box protein [Candidatus Contubernalis alkaliaceticus]|uniref:PAS domain S-box protein n=1 Tax=Candidatus Contubernalis alkaliaceticus TaxID=338645 RepID=UPI001F4C4F77|nr:PAS domain S-box protein [Candidatus Contubernalis alkalaceticus]UNC92700.1 PAS domain S-box protein [Candidatus Contubernalis alkalaceticus]
MGIDKNKDFYSLTNNIIWGTQFCLFYRSKEELIEILAPYFNAGLKDDCICLWVIPSLLTPREAENTLAQAIPDFLQYVGKGQIRIVPYGTWDFEQGAVSFSEAIHELKNHLENCSHKNFTRVQVAVIYNSAGEQLEKESKEYDIFFQEIAKKYKTKTVCSYALDRLDVLDILSIAFKYPGVLMKSKGIWNFFQSDELEKVQNRLVDEKSFSQAIIDTIDGLVIILDSLGNIIRYNLATERIIGCHLKEVQGKPVLDLLLLLLSPEDKQEVEAAVNTLRDGKSLKNENWLLSKEGKKHLIKWSGRHFWDSGGSLKYIICSGIDITEWKQAEDELRKSEAWFRALYEKAAMGIGICDLEGKLLTVNPAVCRMLGYEEEELRGEFFNKFTHPEDVQRNRELRQMMVKVDSQDYFCMEKRYYKKDGQMIWVRLTATLVRDREGRPQFTIEMLEDITNNKATEEALRDSEQRYRLLVDLLPDAVFILQKREIVYANQAAADLTGAKSPEELLEKNAKTFLSPDFWEKIRGEINNISEEQREASMLQEQLSLPNGRAVDVEAFINSIMYKGRPSNLLVLRNVTKRKKMEEEFFKASKLESLGLLAGGIAHDFNNILSIILGNISLARLYQGQKEKMSQKLKEIEKATVMAKELTHQLHTFARGGEPLITTVSVEELVHDAASLILSGSNVRCQYSFPRNLYMVEVDQGQIKQVINNIIINALQAMPDGGTIYIWAENAVIEGRGHDSRVPLKNGPYVRVFIRDEGMGIPKEQRQKIFDPFFTTKEKGSGLGLATSYAIIKRHGGLISVDSEVGVGTTFYIYLPASTLKEEGTQVEKDDNDISQRRGSVLVMDDEEMLREVIGEMLSLIGYEAVFARDGAEAVDLYQSYLGAGHIFDAVIIDLTIPGGMGGKQTIQKLLEIDPKVKAIVTSGYYDDPVVSNYKEYGFKGFVLKPYIIEDLAEVLDQVQK